MSPRPTCTGSRLTSFFLIFNFSILRYILGKQQIHSSAKNRNINTAAQKTFGGSEILLKYQALSNIYFCSLFMLVF